MVDQPDGELTSGEADRLVVVGVDHVVAAVLALDLPGLTASHVVANSLLQLQCHVLGNMADPGALVQSLDETAPAATATAVICQSGQSLHQRIGEAGKLVGGEVF